MGKETEAVVLGMALEIDCDIDAEIGQALGDGGIGPRPPRSRKRSKPATSRARMALPSSGAERDAGHLEAAPIVPLEQLGHQIGGRVAMEIG